SRALPDLCDSMSRLKSSSNHGLRRGLHSFAAPRLPFARSSYQFLRSETRGEGVRTVEILVGSGIEMRERTHIRSSRRLCCRGRNWDDVGNGGQECPPHTGCAKRLFRGTYFQRRREAGGDAARFFGGREHPLIEGAADAAALVLVGDDDEAEEAASRGKARAHGIDAGKHAVEREGHVIVFGELKDGEHTL